MLFNTLKYWFFLAGVLFIFYSLSSAKWRKYFLLAVSYYFYMSWNLKYIVLIIIPTLTSYAGGLFLNRLNSTQKKLCLGAAVSVNLGVLGLFKYYDFFISSIANFLNIEPTGYMLNFILPVGISFYTFQATSYIIDVYRNEMEPIDNVSDFALYVAFFPQLVAGPIVRAKEFFPQLYNWNPPELYQVQEGVFLILLGLIKKMVIADTFAGIADPFFNNIASNSGFLTAWTALLAFTFQIYCDFSGYTDIARGSAKLLGFHFPENFRSPYVASNIADFWRRWHITLSVWFRDYLYIPLGGNRKGALKTFRNLWITMLLCGLWHGASWNFLIWGGYHGILLVGHRYLSKIKTPEYLEKYKAIIFKHGVKVGITFFLSTVGWVFFRNHTFAASISMLHSMFSLDIMGKSLLNGYHVTLMVLAYFFMVAGEKIDFRSLILDSYEFVKVPVFVSLFLIVEIFSTSQQAIQFIYFQF